MFSITTYIGGITLIKEGNDSIAWVNLFGDISFSDCLNDSKRKSIYLFLDSKGIKYNNLPTYN